jgi:hypothetical protein
MTTEHDKAVALAANNGFRVGHSGWSANPIVTVSGNVHQLAAMLADHRQQIIEELAQRSGVMPKLMAIGNACDADEVHEAIASLEALRQQESARHVEFVLKDHAQVCTRLEQSEEQVRELRKAVEQEPTVMIHKWKVLEILDAAIDKESGK